MLTDDELLRDLAEHVPAAELPSLVRRLLRVPEVWQALHQPGLLTALAADQEIRSLLPGSVAAYALGLSSLALGNDPPSAPAPSSSPLQAAATRALHLVHAAPIQTTALATTILSDATAWRSPLACAWPHLPEPSALLRALIADDAGLSLAANALLANGSEEEAARCLQAAVDLDMRLLSRLVALGEASWVRVLSDLSAQDVATSSAASGVDELFSHVDEARCHRARAEYEHARKALQQAWNRSQAAAASIADELADLAEQESDPVTALLARQQALHIAGTPARRAAAARCLVSMKRPEEALTLLPPAPSSPEERIALGLALLEIGDVITGTGHLVTVGESGLESLSVPWLEHLALALETVGRMEHALRAASALVTHVPTTPRFRLLRAHFLLVSGYSRDAVSEASLALALEPESAEARRTLASALQAAGQPQEAIPHWRFLASRDPEHNLDLARCCLEANDPDAAAEALERVLAAEDAPAVAHALLAQALDLKGHPEDARAHLEQASALAPHEPELWITLSRLHAKQGGHDAAGRVLQSAIQLSPASAPLHAALAAWHRSHGQLSRALDAIQVALRLDPSQAEWLTEHGELLGLLGRQHEALPTLTEAVARMPGSRRARLSLARCYEDTGERALASRILADIGDDLDFEGHLLAARVLTQSAQADPDFAPRARSHLEKALSHNPSDPRVHFWLGELHSLAGDFSAALRAHSRAAELAAESEPSFQQQVALTLGRSALAAGDTSLALRVLEDGRQRFPDSLPYLTGLSEAYRAAGRNQLALEVARQALAVQPDAPLALQSLAHAAASLGRWDDALQAHQRLTQLHPDDPEAWLHLARTAHSAQQTPLTRSGLARALRASRANPKAIASTADVLAQLGWLRTAQTALEHALRHSPEEPSLLRHLAEIAEARADVAAAHRAWSALASLTPHDVGVLCRAAEASWKAGKRAVAIGLLQRAVALDPHDIALRLRLARALRDNGEHQACLQQFALALEQSPGDIDLSLEAASMAVQQHAFAEAMPWLERAHAAAPERVDVTLLLAECLFHLDRLAECQQLLEAVAPSDGLTARGAALLALARASTLGIGPALEAFRHGITLPVSAPADATWLAQAALRLGQWGDATRLYRLAAETSGPADRPQAMLLLVDACLHCLEAGWLLRSAEALGHIPPEVQPEDVERLLGSPPVQALPDTEVRPRRARLQCFDLSRNDMPADAPALALIIHQLRRNRPEAALECFDQLTPDNPGTPWLHLALGLAQEALSDGARARDAFDRAAADPLLQPVSSFLIGRTLQTEGEVDRAIQAFNAAVAGWPDEPLWHHRLATLYLAADNLPTALPHLQQAAELAPENASIALTLGRALRLDGQLSEAKAAYAKALPAFPTDETVWKEAAQLALAVGDAESAEAWYERACTLSPSDARCLIGAARAAVVLGKSRLAIDRAQAAARLSPADPDVLLGLGEILARQGKLEKALQAYDQALAHGNRFPITLARARLLVQMGRAGEAALDLKHLLESHPESDVAWAALAEACAAANHTDEALQAAGRAVHLAPRTASHRLLISRLCRQCGQLDRALKEVKEAQALQPADAAVWTELGQVYAARREMHQALEAFQRAISLDPASAIAHFQAGLIFKQLKAYAHASRMFRRAVDLNPRDSEAFHQLAAVNALELVHGGLTHAVVSR